MTKKHLVFLMLMVMAVATASASTWKIHNYYVTKKIQNVFDTGDKIYYLNGDRLYQFDKATLKTVSFCCLWPTPVPTSMSLTQRVR